MLSCKSLVILFDFGLGFLQHFTDEKLCVADFADATLLQRGWAGIDPRFVAASCAYCQSTEWAIADLFRSLVLLLTTVAARPTVLWPREVLIRVLEFEYRIFVVICKQSIFTWTDINHKLLGFTHHLMDHGHSCVTIWRFFVILVVSVRPLGVEPILEQF